MDRDTTPLFGYAGMPAEFPLADGRAMPAGEAVEAGYLGYCDAHGPTTPDAWNNLHEEMRQAAIRIAIENANSTSQAASAYVDREGVTAAFQEKLGATLFGDLIDAALSEVKAMARPWSQMDQDSQSDVLERITNRVKHAGAELIREMATRGRTSIVCELDSITVKKGAKATIDIPKGALDQDLLDAVGGPVLLVIANFEEAASIEAPKAEPNQLPLGVVVVHSDPED